MKCIIEVKCPRELEMEVIISDWEDWKFFMEKVMFESGLEV